LIGDFARDMLNGRGYFKSSKGTIKFGNFENDKFIGPNDEMTDVELFIKECNEKIEESKSYMDKSYQVTIQ